jgi:protein involved in sex pheromone biosynthesis
MKKETVKKNMICILCFASCLIVSGCSGDKKSETKIVQDSTKVKENDRPGSHLLEGMRTNDKKFHSVTLPDIH